MIDTKTRLLDAAEHAARAKGHNGFSYADLGNAVGIRKASIHHHFATKSDLLTALMHRYREMLIKVYSDITADSETAGARLLAFLDVHRNALNNSDTLCLCITLSLERDSLGASTQEEISAFRSATLDWLETLFCLARNDASISNVADPKSEAAATLALAEGAQISARADLNLARFDVAVSLLRARVV